MNRMFPLYRTHCFLILAPLFGLLLGCQGTKLPALPKLPDLPSLQPYKQEVVQGNVVVREQVQALRVGMPKSQVRNILGTPLLTSAFHADRWDYAFTLQRDGKQMLQRRLTVFFQGDAMLKVEGDDMPSEAEFASSFSGNQKPVGKIPTLQADEKTLQEFAKRENSSRGKEASALTPTQTPAADLNKIYPPLEANK